MSVHQFFYFILGLEHLQDSLAQAQTIYGWTIYHAVEASHHSLTVHMVVGEIIIVVTERILVSYVNLLNQSVWR